MNRARQATIFHNPACGTSRKTLEILEQEGVDVEVREYLRHPPAVRSSRRCTLAPASHRARGLRAKEPLAAELGLTAAEADDAILDAMVAHPILINRPLVETSRGVRLCRPQDRVREIL